MATSWTQLKQWPLLVATASAALLHDVWVGLGAALLFSSQLLTVLEVSGRIEGAATWYRLTVLTLYPLGILLIAIGIVRRERHSR